ncbi:MAG: ATP phosphoribosyltransferase regulatory subunit, partial [Nanoarchaeota archaeon]
MILPINFEPLRGFRDYYPKDWKEVNENLFSKAKEIANSFGFEQIEMPIIERTEFLLKKSGEEIKEQIFNVLPKKTIILINKIKELAKELNEEIIEKDDNLIEKITITNLTKLKEYSNNYKEKIEAPIEGNYELFEQLIKKEKEIKEKGLIFNFEKLNKNDLKNNEFLLKFGDEVYLISIKKFKDNNLADLTAYEYDSYLTITFEPLILIDSFSLNPEMSLRFDLTMPAIRMAMRRYKELAKPIKWFYIAKNYRYEEPQKGRDREFFQIGVEFFGEKSFIADLEVLNFAITFLNKIGLKDLYKVKVNDRRLMDYLIGKLVGNNKEKKEKLYRLIDKVRKISEEEFKKEALVILEDEKKVDYLYNLIKKPLNLEEAKDFINELFEKNLFANLVEKAKEIINNQDNLKEQLINQIGMLKFLEKKANIEFDLSIVRGLDYYTGFVFEIYDKEEKYRSLAGGGRYDNLAETLGFEEKIYATGMALGPSVLEVFMKDKGIWKESKEERDFIVIPISKNEFFYAYEIAEKLREKGFKVEFAYKKGISKNLNYANKLN